MEGNREGEYFESVEIDEVEFLYEGTNERYLTNERMKIFFLVCL